MQTEIRIVIIDDHPVILEGISSFLSNQNQFNVVGAAKSRSEALKIFKNISPDLVLLDVSLNDCNGLDLIVELKRLSPLTKFLIFSNYCEQAYIRKALKNGALGYVLKGDDLEKLVYALTEVYAGKLYISSAVPREILAILVRDQDDDPITSLTTRESEVAFLLGKGKSPKEVAVELCISPKTVWVHRSNIMQKLNCRNPADLIIKMRDYLPE